MTAQQNDDVKKALAIYRGLPDDERQERRDAVHRAKYYRTDFAGHSYTPEQRTFAAVLLPYIEQAEVAIQAERAELVRLRAAVQNANMHGRYIRPYTDTDSRTGYGQEGNPDTARLVRGVAILGGFGAIVFAVGHYIIVSGFVPYIIGGGLLIIFLSALPKSGSGNTDMEKKTTEAAAQNIQINITGHGGQIHVTQGG